MTLRFLEVPAQIDGVFGRLCRDAKMLPCIVEDRDVLITYDQSQY